MVKTIFYHDVGVTNVCPDLELSGRGDKDQRRHGGRRLLQKSDNSSLEEAESEESKNCTAPGKRERKRTLQHLPPPDRQIEDGENK